MENNYLLKTQGVSQVIIQTPNTWSEEQITQITQNKFNAKWEILKRIGIQKNIYNIKVFNQFFKKINGISYQSIYSKYYKLDYNYSDQFSQEVQNKSDFFYKTQNFSLDASQVHRNIYSARKNTVWLFKAPYILNINIQKSEEKIKFKTESIELSVEYSKQTHISANEFHQKSDSFRADAQSFMGMSLSGVSVCG